VQSASNGSAFGEAFVTELDPTAAAGAGPVYSTYLGGGGAHQDIGKAIAVDSAGDFIVAGSTSSGAFAGTSNSPIPTVFSSQQPTIANALGTNDAFVTSIDPTSTTLVFSTYLGGSSSDTANTILLDSADNIYVGGTTNSGDFPTTGGSFQPTFNGGANDGFIAEYDSTGTLMVATYVGGSGSDGVNGLAFDSVGNVYSTGGTTSVDLPMTPDAVFPSNAGARDAYVVTLDPTLTSQVFGTYLGGSLNDAGTGIGLDGADNIYVAGNTDSLDFPTTAGVFQPSNAGLTDTFVTKIGTILPPPGTGTGTGTPGFGPGGLGFGLNLPMSGCVGTNPPADRYDTANPNSTDTSDQAVDLGNLIGQQNVSNLTIVRLANGSSDQDWWKWKASSSGTWTVTLNNIQAGTCDLWLRMFILNPANNTLQQVASSTLTGGVATQSASAPVSSGDEVYAWVFGFNYATGSYDMNVRLS
jgi:hypothetical protein